jgi:hypothetical protein
MKRFTTLLLLLALTATAAIANNWYINLKRSGCPSFATVNEPFSLDFTIENNGNEAISTLDIKYSPNGGTAMSVHKQLDEELEAGATATFTVNGFVCDKVGKEVFGTLTLTNVNGEQNSGSDAYVYVVCGNRYIKRNLVVEEATGTTCGFCPEGIVGMEYMREKYNDGSWIGISVFNDSDWKLTSTIYKSWYKHVSGTPKAFANRDFASNYVPTKASLEELYLRTCNDAAVVGIRADIQADAETKKAKLDVTTFYAFDEENAEYTISYIITEDNLPEYQYNNYSGSSSDHGGWENKGSWVWWTFSDVAIDGTYAGIEGSIPTTLNSTDEYKYSCDIDISKVTNISNAYVNVMVNNAKGQIENAVRRKLDGSQNDSAQATTSAIATEITKDSPIVELFDMQGRKVSLDAKRGIFIARHADGTTSKIAR